MVVTDLLPTLKELSRADKLRVMLFLITELAKEEGVTQESGSAHRIWSPYSHEAAQKLATLLEEQQKSENA